MMLLTCKKLKYITVATLIFIILILFVKFIFVYRKGPPFKVGTLSGLTLNDFSRSALGESLSTNAVGKKLGLISISTNWKVYGRLGEYVYIWFGLALRLILRNEMLKFYVTSEC